MTKDELLIHIAEAYKEVNGCDVAPEITSDTTFEDLNLDSLEVVEMALHFEDRLNIKLPSNVVDEARTVGELIAPLLSVPPTHMVLDPTR